MDVFKKAILYPSFIPVSGHMVRWPFVAGAGVTKLRPSEKVFVRNLCREKVGFNGDPTEKCRCLGCRVPLGLSNRYIYCRPHLKNALDDFIKHNHAKNPTSFLETLRRDQPPRKQPRRKRA